MDKNAVLAVVLSFAVFLGWTFYQSKKAPQETTTIESVENQPMEEISSENNPQNSIALMSDYSVYLDEGIEAAEVKTVSMETDLFNIEFTTAGGNVTSLELSDHVSRNGEAVNMVYSVPGTEGRGAFEISFGENYDEPIVDAFYFTRVSATEYHFTQNFVMNYANGTQSAPFSLTKIFKFIPDEYMMKLTVEVVNSENEYIPLNYDGFAYSLTYGPQIGPDFEKLDGRNDYRIFQSLVGGKMESHNKKNNEETYIQEEYVNWASISGKYFTVAAITDSTKYKILWENSLDPQPGESTAFMVLSRPTIKSSKNSDVFHYYMGPKDKGILSIYNDPEENSFNFSDMELTELPTYGTFAILNPIVIALKFIIEKFYLLVHNYGVAIILMTLLIKILLFPITHKSYESTAKMQEVQPLLKEIQEKYKSDPQKLNAETSKLYKEKGVNPLGGCLPMLLQMPILFAVFNMLNGYFELRGAVFIPGWITDLSGPESIYSFGADVNLPFIGNDLRLLPIIYVATQLLSMKFTQSGQAGQSGAQQKIMMYGMPAIFFFVLYSYPSGLLIYWISMNIMTSGQQYYITYNKKKKDGLLGPKKKKN